MSFAATLPNHLRPKREKVFGSGAGAPLDRNAKARIVAYAKAWSAKHKQPRQHRGPLTRAFMEVLEALLWGFHNSRDGRCFPSYEAIADKAGCNRDTVYEALKALEFAGVLSWVNRITRQRTYVRDLFGQWVATWRIIRTSNAYSFRDPLPSRTPANLGQSSKSENPLGTQIQDFNPSPPPAIDPETELGKALKRLGDTLGALPMTSG